MQVTIETEPLKPCPFCGGRPKLIVADNANTNGMVVTEIRCEKCHSAGKTVTSFNGSVTVGSEEHNRIVKEIIEAWNRRDGDSNASVQLMKVCDKLYDISVKLERAYGAIEELSLDYFGERKEVHEKNNGSMLLANFDNARIFSNIADDYVWDASQLVEKLMDAIDLKKGLVKEDTGD